jgi:hypothetical protein
MVAIVDGFSYQCGHCGRVAVDGEWLDEEESTAYATRRKLPKSWGGFGGFYKRIEEAFGPYE